MIIVSQGHDTIVVLSTNTVLLVVVTVTLSEHHLLSQLIECLAVQLTSLLGCQQKELQSRSAHLALSKSLIEVLGFCL